MSRPCAYYMFDLCSMWHLALERGPVAIKKLTALRPASEEIYYNHHFVTGSRPLQFMEIFIGNKDNRPFYKQLCLASSLIKTIRPPAVSVSDTITSQLDMEDGLELKFSTRQLCFL